MTRDQPKILLSFSENRKATIPWQHQFTLHTIPTATYPVSGSAENGAARGDQGEHSGDRGEGRAPIDSLHSIQPRGRIDRFEGPIDNAREGKYKVSVTG